MALAIAFFFFADTQRTDAMPRAAARSLHSVDSYRCRPCHILRRTTRCAYARYEVADVTPRHAAKDVRQRKDELLRQPEARRDMRGDALIRELATRARFMRAASA